VTEQLAWKKKPGQIGDLQSPKIGNFLDTDNNSYFASIKKALLAYFTDDTIAAAGPGLQLAVVLRVEYDGDMNKVDASDRFIENNNWADLFYGDPETFLQDRSLMPPPPRLMKIRARIPDLHGGLPIPKSANDEVAMMAHPVFTAMSEDITALGIPSPGELIWVGFSNISNQTYPFYASRVLSRRAINAGTGMSSPASSAFVGQGQSLGQLTHVGVGETAKHFHKDGYYSLLRGNGKFTASTKGFTDLLKYCKKNPNIFASTRKNIARDDFRKDASVWIVLNMAKTLCAYAIISQFVSSFTSGKGKVHISSGMRDWNKAKKKANHPGAFAMDLKITVPGQGELPKSAVHGIICTLIKNKKLPSGGVGYYMGVNEIEGMPNHYHINADKRGAANVHYDWRQDKNSLVAPRYQGGSKQWFWLCMNPQSAGCPGTALGPKQMPLGKLDFSAGLSAEKKKHPRKGRDLPYLNGDFVVMPWMDGENVIQVSKASWTTFINTVADQKKAASYVEREFNVPSRVSQNIPNLKDLERNFWSSGAEGEILKGAFNDGAVAVIREQLGSDFFSSVNGLING
tara:strand:+ start:746 stop:2458 length:1713 start_codon:yes stop_codon:yes gene_type:complete